MNENFTITQLLIQYLDNELDDAGRREIEELITKDAAVKDELDTLRLSIQAVKSYGARQTVTALHAGMMKELRAEKPVVVQHSIVRRIGRYSLSAAASIIILLVIVAVYQYATLSSDKLFSDNYSPFQLSQTRGAESADTLEELYKQNNINGAVHFFESHSNPPPNDYFIAGNAYLQQHEPAKAIQCFLSLQRKNIEQQTHIYEEDASYYLALAYLQNHEPKKALPLLTEIDTDKRNAYYDKVSSWQLQKIKWLIRKN